MLLFLVACSSTQRVVPSPRIEAAPPVASKVLPVDVSELDADVVVFDISSSETAQIFHICDQMSEWSPFMHRQYLRWAVEKNVLGDRQRKALDAHRALRQRLRYGKLDALFYTTDSMRGAFARASAALAPEDVATERELFDAMTPIVAPLVQSKKKETDELRAQVMGDGPRLAKMLSDFEFFTETTMPKQHVPLWIVASPDKHYGGGGYNGGQMVLEAANGAPDILLHESLHFVLNRRMDDLRVEAKACGEGLDSQTLSEGIAYALYPGIVGRPGVIDETLAHLAAENRAVDFPYVRFNRLGRALVPFVFAALNDKTTLTQMLPATCDAWKRVVAEPWPPVKTGGDL